MSDTEDTELHELLQQIKENNKNAHGRNNWIDYAMRFATTISAAGVIALFSLFTVQIPDLKNSIADVSREQLYMAKSLAEVRQFTKTPRFTKEDFILEMRLYEKRLEYLENIIAIKTKQ